MKFYICDCADHEVPCIYTERTLARLRDCPRSGLKRCIRHGELIVHEREAYDRETLKGVMARERRLDEIKGGIRYE